MLLGKNLSHRILQLKIKKKKKKLLLFVCAADFVVV